MTKLIDRVFGVALLLGALGHTMGTFRGYPLMSATFIWSLGASLAAMLLGVLNLIRAGRPADRTLAMVTFGGTACWALLCLGFGRSIGNLLDPRVVFHLVASIALVLFSAGTLRRGRLHDEPASSVRPSEM